MLGFETIGNATVTVFDGKPILSTDPWITPGAYFGSWSLPYEIPKEQMNHIVSCPYIWISHGHPDHLSGDSLKHLSNSTFLVSDHVGRRIYDGLIKKGFKAQILPERKWVQLSERVKVLSISDYFQDSILIIDVDGNLIVDTNDAGIRGNLDFIRKMIKNSKRSFLLKLFGYGDSDMINCYNEDGTFIPPVCGQRKENALLGEQIKFWANLYGVDYIVPHSCFHIYSREDSIWANEYITPITHMFRDYKENHPKLLPKYIRFNLETDELTELDVKEKENLILSPSQFGDNWQERLSSEEKLKVQSYFKNIAKLGDYIDFVQVEVGGEITEVKYLSQINSNSKGIRFSVPRGSLMTSVNYEIFDDLMIGNFMKTTYLGNWRYKSLDNVIPVIGKFADNGYAKSKEQYDNYIAEYRRRAPLEFMLHRMSYLSEQKFRSFFANQTPIFNLAKKVYSFVR